jgi:outer membrane protein
MWNAFYLSSLHLIKNSTMNKNNLSVALNIILAIAVAVLYYLHFSRSTTCPDVQRAAGDSSAVSKPMVLSPKEIKASKIVFVNTDIINEKYDYVKDLSAVLKANQQAFDNAYKKKATALQNRYQEIQQKASQGLLSDNQTREAQEELAKGKQELDQLEGNQQQLMDQMQKDNEKVLNTVMDYIKEYNKSSHYNYILTYNRTAMSPLMDANDSLDITAEIIEGLNAQYKAKKGK